MISVARGETSFSTWWTSVKILVSKRTFLRHSAVPANRVTARRCEWGIFNTTSGVAQVAAAEDPWQRKSSPSEGNVRR